MLSLNQSGAQNLSYDEFIIEKDPTWMHLKVLTATTDESDSLQFRWNLSCLEENYMKSMNMHRIVPHVNNLKLSHLFYSWVYLFSKRNFNFRSKDSNNL